MRSYKTELDLNDEQRTACLKHAGAARFAYNWGLRRRIDAYKTQKKTLSAIDLHRQLNVLKKTEFPWLYETSKCAPQEALRHLDTAYEHFFCRCKQKVRKKGFPKFKKRKNGIGSFTLTGVIRASYSTVRLPRLGTLRLKERGYFPTNIKITSATVSERAGRWFVSINTGEPAVRKCGTETLGVDVGIKRLAVLSDGTVFENPKALKAAERRLRSLQKTVSRRIKGSNNRKKAAAHLARQHYRIACVRIDAIHKATDAITKRASVLGVESLNVSGMMKNHNLARALADASLGEFLRQIKYKMAWAGGVIIKADQFYPSSKICSNCEHVVEQLPLAVRDWKCPKCECVHDRDINAAKNLKHLAVSFTVTACCLGSSGTGQRPV